MNYSTLDPAERAYLIKAGMMYPDGYIKNRRPRAVREGNDMFFLFHKPLTSDNDLLKTEVVSNSIIIQAAIDAREARQDGYGRYWYRGFLCGLCKKNPALVIQKTPNCVKCFD